MFPNHESDKRKTIKKRKEKIQSALEKAAPDRRVSNAAAAPSRGAQRLNSGHVAQPVHCIPPAGTHCMPRRYIYMLS